MSWLTNTALGRKYTKQIEHNQELHNREQAEKEVECLFNGDHSFVYKRYPDYPDQQPLEQTEQEYQQQIRKKVLSDEE